MHTRRGADSDGSVVNRRFTKDFNRAAAAPPHREALLEPRLRKEQYGRRRELKPWPR